MSDALIQYESACRAVADLRTVGDAKVLRDKAEGLRVYARQAKNRQLEFDATEIRTLAEHKAGELLAEMAKTGRRTTGRPDKVSQPATLSDLGVSRTESSRWQKLAEIPSFEFEGHIAKWRAAAEKKAGHVPLNIAKLSRKTKRGRDRQAEAATAGTFSLDLSAYAASGKKWGCIYADPPWVYDNQSTRAATSNHYNGLSIEELCALPVRGLAADDAHLHLWTTNGFLFECPKIFDAWGFEFRSSLVWVKPQLGIGNYWRNSHEIMLTAVRGDAKRFNDRALKSWFECDRGAHSAKPEIVRTWIQRASPGPYIELFARGKRTGWDVWGNQIEDTLLDRDSLEVA